MAYGMEHDTHMRQEKAIKELGVKGTSRGGGATGGDSLEGDTTLSIGFTE